mmetsp:Transcript_32007/g.71909  ORF Transcript_32007/g.71909 Transcript_32007/m.71909 type:complete len:239 (-) Transcript_32007:3-719(-)
MSCLCADSAPIDGIDTANSVLLAHARIHNQGLDRTIHIITSTLVSDHCHIRAGHGRHLPLLQIGHLALWEMAEDLQPTASSGRIQGRRSRVSGGAHQQGSLPVVSIGKIIQQLDQSLLAKILKRQGWPMEEFGDTHSPQLDHRHHLLGRKISKHRLDQLVQVGARDLFPSEKEQNLLHKLGEGQLGPSLKVASHRWENLGYVKPAIACIPREQHFLKRDSIDPATSRFEFHGCDGKTA